MSLDEHLIECVLGILGDERVSKQINNIVNKNSQFKKGIHVKSYKAQKMVSSKEIQTKLSNEITNLKKENAALNSKNEELLKSCSERNDELVQKGNDIKNFKDKIDTLSKELHECSENLDILNKEKASLIQKNEQYYKSFCIVEKPLDVYNVYKSLPEELRNKNLNFISENSLFAFVSTGVIFLERFWDFIKEELLADRLEYTDKLKVVFDFFFEMKNDIDHLYVRNDCKIGDIYNYDKHIMTHGGQNLGAVSEILFLGFSDNNGKLVKKTIVKVNKC